MTTSIFKTAQDFGKKLDMINYGLDINNEMKKTSMLLSNKLTIEIKSHGFLNGLKVVLLSIFRVVLYDQFSHVRIKNVAKALLQEVEAHSRNGTMDDKTMEKLKKTTTSLAKNSKGKYNDLMTKTYEAMTKMYTEIKEQNRQIEDFHEKDLFKPKIRIKFW